MNLNNIKSPIFVAGNCGLTTLQKEINRGMMFESYVCACETLTNEYIVPKSVFTFDGVKLNEAVKGYFVPTTEAVKDAHGMKADLMQASYPAVMIYESEGEQYFRAGNIYPAVCDMPEGTKAESIYSIKSKSFLA